MIDRILQYFIGFLIGVLIVAVLFAAAYCLPAQADQHDAMEHLRSTAVMVNSPYCTGSGSIVEGRSGHHYLLTNAHVCNCASYRGYLDATFEGGELVHAKIVKREWAVDLCAARVEDQRPALRLGPSLRPFTEINTRGYPGGRLTESHGQALGPTDWTMDVEIDKVGRCPSKSQPLNGLNGNLWGCRLAFTSTLTSLYARPGSSGSPVVNDKGELVGVVSSWLQDFLYDAGMVPFSDVKKFLETL